MLKMARTRLYVFAADAGRLLGSRPSYQDWMTGRVIVSKGMSPSTGNALDSSAAVYSAVVLGVSRFRAKYR